MSSFFDSTTWANTSTASEAVTLDSMRKTMAEFEAKFPASERPVRARMGPYVKQALMAQFPASYMHRSDLGYDSISGLPVEIDLSLGYPSYVIEYADGTEVVHCDGMEPVRRPTRREATTA